MGGQAVAAMAVSLFSTGLITAEGLESVMERFDAEEDEYGWRVTGDDGPLFAELGTEDIPEMPERMIDAATAELGDAPQSRVVLMFNDSDEQYRLALAVARAFAEVWPVVMDDHAGTVETITSPRIRLARKSRDKFRRAGWAMALNPWRHKTVVKQ
jgi:hypothetical protein